MRAFILANISDVVSTLFGLRVGGVEINPFIHFVMETSGVPEALLMKLAIAAGIGLLISNRKPRLLALPTLAFAIIAISNSLVTLGHHL